MFIRAASVTLFGVNERWIVFQVSEVTDPACRELAISGICRIVSMWSRCHESECGMRSLMIRILAGVVVLVMMGMMVNAQTPTPAGGSAPAGDAVVKVPTNPYSLLIENLEMIAYIIIGCSLVAVALIVQGFIRARKSVLLPDASTARMRELIDQRQFKELLDFTEQDPSFVAQALHPALKRAPRFVEMKEAMETSVAVQTSEEFRRLEYINILANIGPLLGLLGTVIGIMQAFIEIRKAGGSTSPQELSQGIAVALGTTMLGLMLAIPCMVAYGVLRTKIDRLTEKGALEAEDLLLTMRPQDAQGGTRPGGPQPTMARKLPAAPSVGGSESSGLMRE